MCAFMRAGSVISSAVIKSAVSVRVKSETGWFSFNPDEKVGSVTKTTSI